MVMAYLGIAALVFFLVGIPLLLAAVIVAAIAGKVLSRGVESGSQPKQVGEGLAVNPPRRATEAQLSLEGRSDRVQAVKEPVSQIEMQMGRRSVLPLEEGVHTVFLDVSPDWKYMAVSNLFLKPRAASESEQDWDEVVRNLLSLSEDPYANRLNEIEVQRKRAMRSPRGLVGQSRTLERTPVA